MLLLGLAAQLLALSAVPSASGFVPAISNVISTRINATSSLRQSCPHLSPQSVLSALGNYRGTGNPIYPPGYIPGRSSYRYEVPGTSVTLACGFFLYTPRQNISQIDSVLNKVLAAYGNPQDQNHPVFDGRDLMYLFDDGSPGYGNMVLAFNVLFSESPWGLTYGEAIAGASGVDYIRRHWPQLDLCCSILVPGPSGMVDHGLITLLTV